MIQTSEKFMPLIMECIENLPTFPGVVLKILEAVRDEKTNLEDLGEILSLDPPLSGKILSLINSAFYALPIKITSVSHAVKLLGLNTVKKVALSFSLLNIVKANKETEFNYAEFWRNSVMAGVVGRILAKKIIPDLAEDAFTLGLLHDIGRLCLNQSMPKQYDLVVWEKKETNGDYYEAERQILGFTHMELSGLLIKKWGLPYFFHEPAENHHLPEKLEELSDPAQVLGKILFLANLVVDYFSGSLKSHTLGSLKSYLTRWGDSWPVQADHLIEEAHRQTKEISGLFEIELKEESEYLELIDKARLELIHISDQILQENLIQQNRLKSLQDEVMRDGMTGLFNYKSFHYYLNQEYNRSQRYRIPQVLVLGDIDNFKKVNDTFGHPAGDMILRVISQLLKDSIRNTDIVARHGGEEFGILLTNTSIADSLVVVERIRHIIETLSMEYEGRIIRVTMSFGVAGLTPESDISKDEWFKQADQALYEAKRSGRNRSSAFIYQPTGKFIRFPARRRS